MGNERSVMDPLSVAAGTAGFLSLGIQVSKGIVVFCRDYRSIDANLEALLDQAKRLDKFATLAEAQLSKANAPQADLSSLLKECSKASNDCSNSINAILGSFINSNGSKSRRRRIAYPLKDKRRLQDLQEKITLVRSNLELSLLFLNLYVIHIRTV